MKRTHCVRKVCENTEKTEKLCKICDEKTVFAMGCTSDYV